MRKVPDVEKAIVIYYAKPEIGTAEIRELLGVSAATACNMKNEVRKAMADRDIKSFTPYTVNTRIAYEIWGIDISDYEKRLKKLREFERSNNNVKNAV